MNRNLRTTVPTIAGQLRSKEPDPETVKNKDSKLKRKQKFYYDKGHRVKEQTALLPGDSVWIPDQHTKGVVYDQVSPRSYLVETPNGTFRRNQRSLRVAK